jgi:hypothetical protein
MSSIDPQARNQELITHHTRTPDVVDESSKEEEAEIVFIGTTKIKPN